MSKVVKKDETQYLAKSKNMVRAIIKARTTKLGTKLSFYAAYNTVKNYQETGIIPEICTFRISDFLNTMKVSKGIAYKKTNKNNNVTTALRSEMDKVLTFQFSVPKNAEVLEKNIFDDNDYKTYNVFTETWADDGKCFFKVNKDVFSNHFINIKSGDFIKTNLEIVAEHKNNYVVRFYDYFKSFLWQKKFIFNKTFKIDNLKVLLGIYTAKSYAKNIGSLKQRILEPAINEINRNTDIIIYYEFVKVKQNKITHINFYARLKSDITTKKIKDINLMNQNQQLEREILLVEAINEEIEEMKKSKSKKTSQVKKHENIEVAENFSKTLEKLDEDNIWTF